MSDAAPPSPGASGTLRASDGHGPSAALRRLGLGFVDRALEVAYWAHFARERAGYVRVTVGILMACAVGFVAVDVLAFGPLWRQLVVARGVMVALMALPLPWVYGRRSERALAAHAQEILLYLAIVPVLSLSWMQHMVARAADDLRVTLTLVPALFVLVCIYTASPASASCTRRRSWARPSAWSRAGRRVACASRTRLRRSFAGAWSSATRTRSAASACGRGSERTRALAPLPAFARSSRPCVPPPRCSSSRSSSACRSRRARARKRRRARRSSETGGEACRSSARRPWT